MALSITLVRLKFHPVPTKRSGSAAWAISLKERHAVRRMPFCSFARLIHAERPRSWQT